MKKKLHIFNIICPLFIILITLPIFQLCFHIFPEIKSTENRILLKFPVLDNWRLKSIHAWTKNYENYFNDNFGFRNNLVRISSIFTYYISANSKNQNSNVIFGKKNWLYYNSPTDGTSFPDFYGDALFDSNSIQIIKNNLIKIKEEFKKRNIEFIAIMAPNKQTVYPEFLPDDILKKRGKRTRADQLDEIFSELKMNFIDLRQVLIQEKYKTTLPLFMLTDTHWNQLGAFFGYQKIINEVNKIYPNTYSLNKDQFDINKNSSRGSGDLAGMVNLKGVLPVDSVSLTPRIKLNAVNLPSNYKNGILMQTKNGNKFKKLVSFRDSFSTALIPYLAESFSSSLYLWQGTIDLNIVDKEKPDIVMLEFVERYTSILEAKNLIFK